MGRRHFKPEQIIHMLREAEIKLAGGKTTGEVCRELGISEQSYYRWRKEYGGMQVSQARKLKDLERENARLKKLVAEQALDKAILEKADIRKLWTTGRHWPSTGVFRDATRRTVLRKSSRSHHVFPRKRDRRAGILRIGAGRRFCSWPAVDEPEAARSETRAIVQLF
jgi:transposase-like protein